MILGLVDVLRQFLHQKIFSFDKDKEVLIEALFDSGSFAETHDIVAKLENYRYFSAKEVVRVLDAVDANNQFGGTL